MGHSQPSQAAGSAMTSRVPGRQRLADDFRTRGSGRRLTIQVKWRQAAGRFVGSESDCDGIGAEIKRRRTCWEGRSRPPPTAARPAGGESLRIGCPEKRQQRGTRGFPKAALRYSIFYCTGISVELFQPPYNIKSDGIGRDYAVWTGPPPEGHPIIFRRYCPPSQGRIAFELDIPLQYLSLEAVSCLHHFVIQRHGLAESQYVEFHFHCRTITVRGTSRKKGQKRVTKIIVGIPPFR